MDEVNSKLERLCDDSMEAYANRDYQQAEKLFAETLTICFVAIPKYLYEKCRCINAGLLFDEDVINTVEQCLIYLKESSEATGEDTFETAKLIIDDCNDWLRATMFGESEDYYFCLKKKAYVLFSIGDIAEKLYQGTKPELFVPVWDTACYLLREVISSPLYSYIEEKRKMKEYTDKIRAFDSNYPNYELPYEAKTFEEKLEVCKREKRLRKGIGDEVDNFIIPEEIEVIETGAFSLSKITEIVIPKNVRTIEYRAFISCTKLRSIVFEDDSQLEYIGEEAFVSVKTLSICIPKSVKRIEKGAFASSSLSTLDIENGSCLERIGDQAFQGTTVRKVILPNGCVVGNYAFAPYCKIKYSSNQKNAQTISSASIFDAIKKIWQKNL